jgi:hypothetical protein
MAIDRVNQVVQQQQQQLLLLHALLWMTRGILTRLI